MYLLWDSITNDPLLMKLIILGISSMALLFIVILAGVKMGNEFCIVEKEKIGKVKRCRNVVAGGSKARIFPETIIVDLS